MNEVFFVDLEGKVIQDDEINSHIGLAQKIVNENEELKSEYDSSEYEHEDMFLLKEIGYSMGCNSQYSTLVIINKEKSTPVQKQFLHALVSEGFSFYFTNEEETMEKKFGTKKYIYD